jgi:hypothetical protein
MGTILASGYLQSILGSAFQSLGPTTKTAANSSGSASVSSVAQPDSGQLSPFAQLLSTLQQLQQSSPAQYQQITQQIATNLQSAAQTAQAAGNSTAANQLNQLATDFTNASQNGQLPSAQDLARGIFGQHHHHHSHSAAASGDSGGSSGTGANQALNQLLSTFQTVGQQNSSLSPMTIILNTLSSAGIANSNS